MYKHTITRVRQSVDVEWPSAGVGRIFIRDKYDIALTSTISEDLLTISTSRQSADISIFTSIDNDLADPTSDLYWITQHCIDNNITATSTLEEI